VSVSSVPLEWAPPVLTTTPGGAEVVVDPVDVDGVGADVVALDVDGPAVDGVDVAPDVGSAAEVDAPEGSAEFSACVPPADADDEVDDVDEGDDGESPGVSAHATRGPVRRTAPTPSATAKDPTRPTYVAAFI
jgi:hypothetical protein